MNGYVKKTIRGKRALCKTVTTHTRNGRAYKRELCYEEKPDGRRGRLISSAIAGKPKYTVEQLRNIEESRSPKSRGRDEASDADTIISPDNPRVNSWAKNPSVRRRIDVRGIDTVPTRRHPAKTTGKKTIRKGDIVCEVYTTIRGNKYEKCRNIKTGEFVSNRVL